MDLAHIETPSMFLEDEYFLQTNLLPLNVYNILDRGSAPLK